MLPRRIESWSLTSLHQRLVKTGGRLVKHSRYYWLLLAESHLTRRLFGSMLQRIWACPCRPVDGPALPETVGEERTKAGDVSTRISEASCRASPLGVIRCEIHTGRNPDLRARWLV